MIITHEDDVAAYAGRVVRLEDGRVISDETQQRRVLDADPATGPIEPRPEPRTARSTPARSTPARSTHAGSTHARSTTPRRARSTAQPIRGPARSRPGPAARRPAVNLYEAFRIALRGLRANRLRSVLTTLGIVIGVAAVIVLVALGNGIQAGFTDSTVRGQGPVTVGRCDLSTLRYVTAAEQAEKEKPREMKLPHVP